jgi:hypothetical protein
MMNADVSFLDRLDDRTLQPVNLQSAGVDSELSARSAEVWTAVTLYHTGGHGHTHLRESAGFSSVFICDKDPRFFHRR